MGNLLAKTNHARNDDAQQHPTKGQRRAIMSSLDALDVDIGGLASNPASVFGSIAMNGDEYVRCNRCGYGGCDIRVSGCGCTMHAVSISNICYQF